MVVELGQGRRLIGASATMQAKQEAKSDVLLVMWEGWTQEDVYPEVLTDVVAKVDVVVSGEDHVESGC
uniref:Uncharacterized protein n=1 Tax=Brassica campestris TaxID=3711 RepID=M4DPQ3_BRACM